MADTYRGEIRVEAHPDRVFDHFTDARSLARWMGDRAVVDPRPGGRFTLFIEGGPIEGRYVAVERPERLVITWGRAGSGEFPPGASRLEVTLVADGTGTLVRVEHSGLPSGEFQQHDVGWRHYLGRLAVVAEGGDPGPDPWAVALPADAVPTSDAAPCAVTPVRRRAGRT
jgi:uncharacterized protein YndB with AHSA1/START domain